MMTYDEFRKLHLAAQPRASIPPGTRLDYNGQEIVAVDMDALEGSACGRCALYTASCAQPACKGVVWMTPINAITIRLRS